MLDNSNDENIQNNSPGNLSVFKTLHQPNMAVTCGEILQKLESQRRNSYTARSHFPSAQKVTDIAKLPLEL